MPTEPQPLLVIVPNVGMARHGDRLFLDIKATEGLCLFVRNWPGRVRCLFREVDPGSIGYGRDYEPAEIPCEVHMLPRNADAAAIAPHAADASIILAGADSHLDLGLVAALPGVPVVLTIEYTLRTRLDIVRLGDAPWHRKARTALWLLRTERARRRALAQATGIQANGTPAFDAYGPASASPMLYFDTRLSAADVIGEAQADAKAAALVAASAPLRLAFTGRLEPMKGADDLVRVMAALRRRGDTRTTLDIYGDGSLRSAIARDIREAGLGDTVRLHAPLDFNAELVPLLKARIDLFLCCHKQGDPSCTYLETMGCGVPIVGYLNEAFRGILALGDVGVGMPMGAIDAMAQTIGRLDADRVQLGALVRTAAAIARDRPFESVFQERTAHLRAAAGI